MPTIIIPQSQITDILPVLDRKASDFQVVTISIRKRKRLIVKGELLHLYFRNQNKRLEKLAVVKCKAVDNSGKMQLVTLRNTYDRKYYLNRKVKAAGFKLELELTAKTIMVTPEMAGSMNSPTMAKGMKALKELSRDYNYGVQYMLI